MQLRLKLATGLFFLASSGMLSSDVSPWYELPAQASEHGYESDVHSHSAFSPHSEFAPHSAFSPYNEFAPHSEFHAPCDFNPHIGPRRACDGAICTSACDEMICDEFGCDSGLLKRKQKSSSFGGWVNKVWSKVAFWKD